MQFIETAPKRLELDGRVYALQPGNTHDTDTHWVAFTYRLPRKRRGAVYRDFLLVIVSYLPGVDLYSVAVRHSDGMTGNERPVVYDSEVAGFPYFAALAARVRAAGSL